jgi:nucleoside-diphosphate-sugar epimerase
MPDERVLVTGATGLVGVAAARKAAEQGYRVRAMVRATSDRSELQKLGVEMVEADLGVPDSLPPLVDDVDVVIHTAAHVGDWGPAEKYRAINVVGLEHLLAAAERAGKLRRWVQVSTLGVYQARHHYGTDETESPDVAGLDGYTRTKAEAEVLLRQHIDQNELPAVIVRPGFIYGPGERHWLPGVVEKIQTGKMKLVGDGRKVLNNVYVGNLVDAIFLAVEKEGIVGEVFNVRDERLVTREELIYTIADYLGKPHPRKVPEWVARGVVGIIEGLAKLRGATEAPLLTRARIKFLTLNLDFSIEKAKRVLGYQPRVDFKEGIKESLDWITGRA